MAAGAGGRHTVYGLYHCTRRTLSDFVGQGALNNRQEGNAVTALRERDGSTYALYWPTGSPVRIETRTPVWYLDVC